MTRNSVSKSIGLIYGISFGIYVVSITTFLVISHRQENQTALVSHSHIKRTIEGEMFAGDSKVVSSTIDYLKKKYQLNKISLSLETLECGFFEFGCISGPISGYEPRTNLKVVHSNRISKALLLILSLSTFIGIVSLVFSRWYLKSKLASPLARIDGKFSAALKDIRKDKDINWSSERDLVYELAMLDKKISTSLTDLQVSERQKREFLTEKEIAIHRNRLASQVSHDIRSPLAALQVIADSSHELPDKKREIFQSAVLRIRDIVNNLEFKKSGSLSADQPESKIEAIDDLLNSIISEKQTQYQGYPGIEIRMDLKSAEQGIFSRINAIELKRIISNLVNNAVEATVGATGLIEVRLKRSGTKNILVVEDTGKGIPSENLERIFEDGVSYGKESSVESGSGMGLFHAKSEIRKCGGEIFVESELGLGSKFTIELPACQGPH